MTTLGDPGGFFSLRDPVRPAGRAGGDGLAYRWYDPDRIVLGHRMEDQLRFAVCWWHSFCWPGTDPFGGDSFPRPWFRGDPMQGARQKVEVGFELFRLLGVPFFTFHDRDIAPEGASLSDSDRNVRSIAEAIAAKIEAGGPKLLWGTANLFSNRRFMAGAGSNPDPDVFAYAAAQVKTAMDVTRELGGENYVLWGGREGYETLLNTDLERELDQIGRFLNLVVDYKHKTGFKGTILIEPKPKEPTKHQYDFDVGTVYGLLCRAGLDKEVKVNIEQNHAILAGHSFEHEIAMASALGLFGSIDINRGDDLLGWDTDQFAMSVPELTLMCVEILKAGGFTTGGLNFDAKIRRQSIDPDDLVHAHVGSIDACARALLAAETIITDGTLAGHVAARYAGWETAEAKAMLAGERSLEAIAARVHEEGLDPQPKSGRQEYLEGLVNTYL